MNCPRCNGMMVREAFEDLLGEDVEFLGWRCLHCGEILDPLILRNRTARPAPAVSRPRRRAPCRVTWSNSPGVGRA